MKLDISLHSLELDDPAAKSGLWEEFSKRLKDKVINQKWTLYWKFFSENVPSCTHFIYLFFGFPYLQNPFFNLVDTKTHIASANIYPDKKKLHFQGFWANTSFLLSAPPLLRSLRKKELLDRISNFKRRQSFLSEKGNVADNFVLLKLFTFCCGASYLQIDVQANLS